MRAKHAILLAAVLLTASWAAAAIVHVSTFDQSEGANPVTAGDATRIWAVDGSFSGSVFGHYSYTGTGQLALVSPSIPGQDNQDPFMELDTSTMLTAGEDFQVVLDCAPIEVSGDYANQGLVLAMTNAATGNESTWKSGEIALVVCNRWGRLRLYFTNTPTSIDNDYELITMSRRQVVDLDPASITDLRLIITYTASTSEYKAYYSENSGLMKEIPQSFVVAHAKPVVNITLEQWWSGTGYAEHAFALDNLTVSNSINVTSGVRQPLQERIFHAPNNTADFYSMNVVGDLNGEYKANAQIYNYNGTGLFVAGHPAANTGWPNASITMLSAASAPVSQFVIDVAPGFTNDGIGQMFNLWFGSDIGIFVANGQGAGKGLGIFAWQDDIYALLPKDAAMIDLPAADITSLRLVLSYVAATGTYRLFWSVNGSALQEHPNSPHLGTRSFTTVEFQWQVWVASNPSAFTVALDNFEEYDQIKYGEPPAAAAAWNLYE